MRDKDEINERRRQRIRDAHKRRLKGELHEEEEIGSAYADDVRKRLEVHKAPMAVPPHGLMPKLRHKDMDAPDWRVRLGFRLARWLFWWKRKWRRLFPEKPAPESFEASRERVAGEEYEQRKQEFLKEKGGDDGIRDKEADE